MERSSAVIHLASIGTVLCRTVLLLARKIHWTTLHQVFVYDIWASVAADRFTLARVSFVRR
eukprot:scaffold26981_cov157-Cylindrotheca_fusiformis.AAC.7